jgi:monovalent cation/hydrogen antiporter
MELHAIQTVFLLLMVIVAVFAVIAERMRVPYPIVMVVAGLGLSFVPHMPRIPLDPDLVFAVILPPLLYAAAWTTSWREFRQNLVTISMLAVGLVAFTVWGVAEVADRFITALDWKSGFVLGAVVSTTDAIAASSIATRVGLPKRVMDTLNGESLVNDATGLLALQFGVAMMVHGQTPTVGMGIVSLLWLIAGGLGAGLAVGVIVAFCERFVDDGPVEIVLSIVTPYAAYLVGEAIGASGVLSVVVAGLFLSRRSGKFYSPEVRVQSLGVWHAIDFALNGVVFCMIGLQLPYVLAGIKGYDWKTLVLYGTVFSGVLIALRLVWMYPAATVAWWIRKHILKQTAVPPTKKAIFIIGWTGMRGVLALAAAFALPETLADGRPFAQRNLIVFLAYVVILVTLVGQGLTLPWIIRKLGLAGVDTETAAEVRAARKAMLEAGLAWLHRERAMDSPDACHFYDDVSHQFRHRLASLDEDANGEQPAKFGKLVQIEQGAAKEKRRVLLALRDSGRIGDEALRTVENDLDLQEIRFDREQMG